MLMVSTNLQRRIPFSNQQVSTTNSSTSPKSPTKTSKIKCFKCLGFGHIALHCPLKQTLKINKVKQDLTHPPPATSKNEKDKEGQLT